MSCDGLIAFKLLGQTPKSFQSSQALDAKLVRGGVINSKLFYKLLGAWTSKNVMAYSFSEAQFKPQPKEWIDDCRSDKVKGKSILLNRKHNNLNVGLKL